MDKHGFFSFGTGNSLHATIVEGSETVIVEVSDKMPYVYGGNDEALHISDVDLIVESDNQPLVQVPSTEPTAVDRQVGQHVMEHLGDGSVIQLGIGVMPNAIGEMIARSDLKDLGGHTEMLVDAYVDMYESGVMTGKRKAFDRGRIAFTFALGTQRLYEWMDRNRAIASYPADYTNHPQVIARHDNAVSITNAIEVDLYGQVAAKSLGPRQISGNGGMLDFVYGAFHSRGGKSFICLPSLTGERDGTEDVQDRARPGPGHYRHRAAHHDQLRGDRVRGGRPQGQNHLGASGTADQHRPSRSARRPDQSRGGDEHLGQVKQDLTAPCPAPAAGLPVASSAKATISYPAAAPPGQRVGNGRGRRAGQRSRQDVVLCPDVVHPGPRHLADAGHHIARAGLPPHRAWGGTFSPFMRKESG